MEPGKPMTTAEVADALVSLYKNTRKYHESFDAGKEDYKSAGEALERIHDLTESLTWVLPGFEPGEPQ